MATNKNINISALDQSAAIEIKEFSVSDMVINPSIVMIAKRRSGKSWVVRAILHHFAKSIPVGIIISPTDRLSAFYSDFVPDTFIHFEFSGDLVKKILSRQTFMREKAKERAKEGKETNVKAFLIMDDCLADKGNWAKDKMIFELLFNGRHYQITYILTMQFPLGIKPELRTNFDYVFLLKDDAFTNQKRIYEHYASMFPCFDAFRQVFTQLTADYGCMVINNAGDNTGDSIDKIQYYRAPNLSGVKSTIGGRQYNKFHDDNYDPKWILRDTMFGGGAADEKLNKETVKKNGVTVRKVKN